jgi:BioD-like phosphotransacetylase family protein
MLCNPTVDLIREELRAELLNQPPTLDTLVDDVVVGAMGAQNAVQFFKPGVLLITPGDREDIVLAVGATIESAKQRKNGGHRPDRRFASRRERAQGRFRTMPIPVLLAQADSYQVASKVHNLTVKTRPFS